MSKQTKFFLASAASPYERSTIKRLFIQADLAKATAPKARAKKEEREEQ